MGRNAKTVLQSEPFDVTGVIAPIMMAGKMGATRKPVRIAVVSFKAGASTDIHTEVWTAK